MLTKKKPTPVTPKPMTPDQAAAKVNERVIATLERLTNQLPLLGGATLLIGPGAHDYQQALTVYRAALRYAAQGIREGKVTP